MDTIQSGIGSAETGQNRAPLEIERVFSLLRSAQDADTGLFSRKLALHDWIAVPDDEKISSSLICAIGLSRFAGARRDQKYDPRQTLMSVSRLLREIGRESYRGLLLWSSAVDEVFSWEQFSEHIAGGSDGTTDVVPTLTTMELAWFILGELHAKRAYSAYLARSLQQTIDELVSRQQPDSGLFLHAGQDAPFNHRLRKRVPNFADQIYPILALAAAAREMGDKSLGTIASRCARALCAKQGPMGEWWWHYSPTTSKVVHSYPVYSVHQLSMAPMAFLALAAVDGSSVAEPIRRSEEWIHRNQAEISMIDPHTGTCWRAIEPDENGLMRLTRHARAVIGDVRPWTPERLRVLRETWPYEWGWYLYRQALEHLAPTGTHIF